MIEPSLPTNYQAIDLTRMKRDDLAQNPRPVSEWPVMTIDVAKVPEDACIASWRRDIATTTQISNRLSECAWDAINMGFSFMLCDIVSLQPTNDQDVIEKLIGFSRLYSTLHSVVAYDVEPDLYRPWLKYEGIKILNSPTQLPYLQLKWVLPVPLRLSLQVYQVCTRRLGVPAVKRQYLSLCDGASGRYMRMSDLRLAADNNTLGAFATIALDRIGPSDHLNFRTTPSDKHYWSSPGGCG